MKYLITIFITFLSFSYTLKSQCLTLMTEEIWIEKVIGIPSLPSGYCGNKHNLLIDTCEVIQDLRFLDHLYGTGEFLIKFKDEYEVFKRPDNWQNLESSLLYEITDISEEDLGEDYNEFIEIMQDIETITGEITLKDSLYKDVLDYDSNTLLNKPIFLSVENILNISYLDSILNEEKLKKWIRNVYEPQICWHSSTNIEEIHTEIIILNNFLSINSEDVIYDIKLISTNG